MDQQRPNPLRPGTLKTTPGELFAVACPSATNCVAVYLNSANVLTITNGAPGAILIAAGVRTFYGITCTTTTTCVAVGASSSGQGAVVSVTNGIPGPVRTVAGTTLLTGVACPSASTCVAVDNAPPSVVPIVNGVPGPAQAAATLTASGAVLDYSLGGVACRSTASCQAVGGVNARRGGVVLDMTPAVTKDATSTTLEVTPPSPQFGSLATFTAAVVPPEGKPNPTGTARFYVDDQATPVATVALVGGKATFATAGLGVGTHAVTVAYGGDANSAPSTTGPRR